MKILIIGGTKAEINELKKKLGFRDLTPTYEPGIIKIKPFLEVPKTNSKFYVVPHIQRGEQLPKTKPTKSKTPSKLAGKARARENKNK